jgi:ribosomal protein S18 acetylase RimI-like enzyme
MNIEIRTASNQTDIDSIRLLFREYEKAIGVDLCFQGFAEELAELPGRYSSPEGALLLAFVDSQLAGCVALRWFDYDTCEMKRLYVRPDFRGLGLGRKLAQAIINEATQIGYTKMRLDTLPSMTEAIAMYKTLGFVEIEPYRYNPVKGAIYMEKELS